MNGNYAIGEYVLGCWKLAEMIGEGSYSKVYKAIREENDNTYYSAIKIITVPQSQSEVKSALSEDADERSVTEYFSDVVKEIISEINMMEQLNNSNHIVNYLSHRVIPHVGQIGWDIIICMELLTPLLEYAKINPLSQDDVKKLGIDICSALELCGEKHIVHRDIKPENIFVDELGNFKLGDFGIARTIERTSAGLSKKGTYAYMAPEVYLGKPYNATVDIYSLGIVMYRFLNKNRTPFLPPAPEKITLKDKEISLAQRMKGVKLPAPADADKSLSKIILKACEYEPKERYISATEMKIALNNLESTESITVIGETTNENSLISEKPVFKRDNRNPVLVASKQYGRCQICSRKIEAGRKLCSRCSAAKKRKKKLKLIAGIVAIIILVCTGFAFGARKIKSNNDLAFDTVNNDQQTNMETEIPEPVASAEMLSTPIPSADVDEKTDIVAEGEWSSNISWTLSTEGILNISGQGTIAHSSVLEEYQGRFSEIIISEGITSIGYSAFSDCSSLRTVTIPNSATSIENLAFYNCNNLTSIIIPNSVVSIGYGAFYGCRSLRNITIPDSITSIEARAFQGCSSLKEITIPNNVTSIEYSAFSGCSSLTNITIPNSVKSIGVGAFSDCTSLNDIVVPNGVASIEYKAFYGTPWYESQNDEFVVVGDGVLIKYNGSESVVEIPSTVKYISDAFQGCDSLTDIKLPNSVTVIGDDAFFDCNNLANITIPDSVTSIEGHAFYCCKCLTNIIIPGSVTSIGDNAFSDCSHLTSITIPDSVTSVGMGAFGGTPWYKSQNDKFVIVGDGVLIKYDGTESNVEIPEGVKFISSSFQFENGLNIKSVTIPNGVTTIGNGAFTRCRNLTEIIISNTVISIGANAFSECSSLEKITIPNSVTSIGEAAFAYCNSLAQVYIPANCTYESEFPDGCTVIVHD